MQFCVSELATWALTQFWFVLATTFKVTCSSVVGLPVVCVFADLGPRFGPLLFQLVNCSRAGDAMHEHACSTYILHVLCTGREEGSEAVSRNVDELGRRNRRAGHRLQRRHQISPTARPTICEGCSCGWRLMFWVLNLVMPLLWTILFCS
jgi:hypothetical protein